MIHDYNYSVQLPYLRVIVCLQRQGMLVPKDEGHNSEKGIDTTHPCGTHHASSLCIIEHYFDYEARPLANPAQSNVERIAHKQFFT